MDFGIRTPLFEFFRRGEVAHDVRLLAARGALAPRAHEQLAILGVLLEDPDPEVARTASATLDALPPAPLAAFLARSDCTPELRAFFAARGIEPAPVASPSADDPLLDTEPDLGELADASEAPPSNRGRPMTLLTVMERLKLAMRGTREQRAVLIHDPNKLIAVGVLSSPKLSESEVESFARMANVSEEVLRLIGTSRNWVKNYSIMAALAFNPKSPPGLTMGFVQRLNDRDVKMIAADRNVSEPVRIAARKRLLTKEGRRA